jgi:hypothetical protein
MVKLESTVLWSIIPNTACSDDEGIGGAIGLN